MLKVAKLYLPESYHNFTLTSSKKSESAERINPFLQGIIRNNSKPSPMGNFHQDYARLADKFFLCVLALFALK
jgi:hypothetical protein